MQFHLGLRSLIFYYKNFPVTFTIFSCEQK